MSKQKKSQKHRASQQPVNPTAKIQVKPKRNIAKILAVTGGVFVVVAITVFVIWYAMQPKLFKLTLENDKYKDASNGVSYISADVNYEPIAVGEAYADYNGTTLYQISGLEPTKWLSEEYSGVGAVYYADTITLPGLADWQSDSIRVCESDEITIQKSKISDADEIAAIVAAATTNPLESEPTAGGTSGEFSVYHLKFTSSVYTGLFYDLLYLDDGVNTYFYDRSTKLYYNAGELLLTYLPRNAATE